MRHVVKRLPTLYTKALTAADVPGTFEAIVATFGNEDPVNDVVMPGSFLDTIKAGLAPVVWSHDWLQPPIGVTLEMDELTLAQLKALLPGGVPDDVTGALYAKARLLIDVAAGEDVPLARAIYAAMLSKGGDGRPALGEFSWGGDVLVEKIVKRDDTPWPQFQLEQIDLCEWGPCLKGMNPETALLATKAAVAPVDPETARRTLARGYKATTEAADALSPRQTAMAGRLRDVVTTFGQFDKTAGGNGAFYDADGNPFAARGVVCANCVFFTPDEGSTKTGKCDLVAGQIDAVDWCKLFVIPAGKITGSSGGSKSVEPQKTKAADLPFAPRDTAWEPEAARARVTELLGEGADLAEYDSLPVADVVDGELKCVPDGVIAAAASLADDADAEVKDSVEGLYERMRSEFADDQIVVPWDATKSQPPAVTPEQRRRVADLLLAS